MFKAKQRFTSLIVACVLMFASLFAAIVTLVMPQTTAVAETQPETMTIAATSGDLASNKSSISWESANFTLVNYKASSSSDIRTSDSDHFRVYVGNQTVIKAKDGSGAKITKLVITSTGSSYNITDGSTIEPNDAALSVSGTSNTITFYTPTDTCTITAGKQWRLKSIEITYQVQLDDSAVAIKEELNKVNAYMQLSYKYTATTSFETVIPSIEDTLDKNWTGVTGNSYTDWSDKTATSDAVYAGNTSAGTDIQLRSNNSNSGIVTTFSGGTAKKIAVTWHSNTAIGRTLNVYGSNTAYSAATDLYDSNAQGTLLGTIVCGTSTELKIDGDYAYIGLRSASGAMYLTEIKISWAAAGAAEGEGTQQEVTTYSDSKFVIRCGIDADITDIVGVESYGIRVSAGGKTVDYNSTSANSWAFDETNNRYYVVINLGDIINDTAKLGTEFTVQAYVVYDGTTYVSTSTKTYSVASMIKDYHTGDWSDEVKENVKHLYDYLVSKGLIEEEVA